MHGDAEANGRPVKVEGPLTMIGIVIRWDYLQNNHQSLEKNIVNTFYLQVIHEETSRLVRYSVGIEKTNGALFMSSVEARPNVG